MAASWTLAGVVALSLVLGALLWSSSPSLPTGLPGGAAPGYVAADAVGRADAAALLMPARLVLLYADGPDVALGDPAADPVFQALWSATRALLGAVGATQQAAARLVGRKQVAAAVAAATAADGLALEVDLGPRLPWAQWWTWLGRGAWRGPECPAVDRLYVLPEASTTRVFLVSGYCGVGLVLPASDGRAVAGLLRAEQGQPQPLGYPVQPLPPVRGATFAVEPGIYVPASPGWAAVRLQRERIDPDQLAAAVFPDPLGVRVSPQADGSINYTDPGHWVLSVSPATGTVDLTVPPSSPEAVAGTWLDSLEVGVKYVERKGGWPPSAWLAAVVPTYQPGRCTLGACAASAYEFDLETRYLGLPVLGTAPAVSVTVGAAQVFHYARSVPVPGGPAPGSARRWLSAAAALTLLQDGPPPSLTSPPMEVDDVEPAWAPLPVAGVLEPAWAVRLLPQGGGAARLVLVDALRGQVLEVVTGG